MVFNKPPELFGFEKYAILKEVPLPQQLVPIDLLNDKSYVEPFLKHNQRALSFLKRFSGIKSILVLLSSYYQGDIIPVSKFTRYLARFAWGYDYHLNLKRAATDFFLANFKKDNFVPGFHVLTDSHPLNEKYIAYKAGLGFYGKNSLLINPEIGSYFNITLILTELDLIETISEVDNSCQECEICQKSCPTGALQLPFKLNVESCISFQTIENKQEIPEPIFSKVKNRHFYGCDLCQSRCPFNRKIKVADKKWNLPIDYEDLLAKYLNVSPSIQFRKLFREEFKNLGLNRLSLERFQKNYKKIIEGEYGS